MKNERVCITPTAPANFRVYGTRKTVHGVPVVEVHAGFYLSPDFRYSATRNEPEDGPGWEIQDSRDRNAGDFARDKRAAIAALAAYMAMR
jgi:hypothetical protein